LLVHDFFDVPSDEDDLSQEEVQPASSGQSNPQNQIIPFDVQKQKNNLLKEKTQMPPPEDLQSR
jgi:hypothetical protein